MASDDLEHGDGVKEIEEDGWFILWDGRDDSWLRARPGCQLEFWR